MRVVQVGPSTAGEFVPPLARAKVLPTVPPAIPLEPDGLACPANHTLDPP